MTSAGATLSESESAFLRRAIGRRRLFLALSAAGLLIAVGLSGYYTWRRIHDPRFAVGARSALILLILLNSRQNLRQYRYAGVLAKLAALPAMPVMPARPSVLRSADDPDPGA